MLQDGNIQYQEIEKSSPFPGKLSKSVAVDVQGVRTSVPVRQLVAGARGFLTKTLSLS